MKDLPTVCAQCGVNFLCERGTIYKVRTNGCVKRFCSYSCWIKYKEDKRNGKNYNQKQT